MEAAPEAAPQEATAAQEEFDADEVAALLWPDADDEERLRRPDHRCLLAGQWYS